MSVPAMQDDGRRGDRATTRAAEGFAPRRCPLCGGVRADEVFTTVDHNHGFPGAFRFVRCAHCDLVYQSPCALSHAIKDLYPQDYATPAALDPSELTRKISMPVHRRRAEIIEAEVPKGSLLEIGCGGGLFAKYMQHRGWRVAGLEASAANVEYARSRLGLKDVRQGFWPPANGLPPRADVVVMIHLIEHLIDPVHALVVARRVLSPGGVLMLETPNAESWPLRLFMDRAVTVDAPRHLALFTKKTLKACVRMAGFEVCGLITYSPSTMEYSESLRYCLQRHGLRRSDKIFGRASAGHGKPSCSRRAPRESKRARVKSLLHVLEHRSYAAINALADGLGAGNNLVMVARRARIASPQ